MKALILNSGRGTRMKDATKNSPKCMTELCDGETILQKQLKQLENVGITEVIITTGPFVDILEEHAKKHFTKGNITFVNNPLYAATNYIYSIYLARQILKDSDLIMLHGDLVIEDEVVSRVCSLDYSAMVISSTLPLPKDDFKAVVKEGKITDVGIEFFESAYAAQPFYKLKKADWLLWLDSIEEFVDKNETGCYAENALNAVSDKVNLSPYDVENALCGEIDTLEDLERINSIICMKEN